MANMTIKQRAAMASGRERHCAKCEFKVGALCPYIEICDAAYRRGYVRGHKDCVKLKK